MRLKRKGDRTTIDLINAALGLLLILGTFASAGGASMAAMWSGGLIGLAIAVTALTTVVEGRERQDAANLVFGLLALAAPFVLEFSDIANAAGTHVFVGLIVATLTGLQMAERYLLGPPTRAA